MDEHHGQGVGPVQDQVIVSKELIAFGVGCALFLAACFVYFVGKPASSRDIGEMALARKQKQLRRPVSKTQLVWQRRISMFLLGLAVVLPCGILLEVFLLHHAMPARTF